MVFSDKLVLISSLTGLISLAQLQNMFFSNLVAKIQCSDCIYFIWGRESAAKYNSAVAAGAASFHLYYYSLVFDDSPRAQCQQASAGTGFADGGGIYCLSAGGASSLARLFTCRSTFEPQQRATARVGRFSKYLREDTHALLLVWLLYGITK